MKDINIELLKNMPALDTHAVVCIRPLAPLSMVSDMPGSYYKTLKKPNKKMICGLFENILGWHIDLADRKLLYRDLKKVRNKAKWTFIDKYKGSTYLPLLMDYFEIEGDVQIDKLKSACFYDDMWKRCFRRDDVGGGLLTHVNGCQNIDYSIIAEYHTFDDKDNREKERWVYDHSEQFPFYYSTPTKREFLYLDGIFKINLCIDNNLFTELSNKVYQNNIGYFGNSEGWIDIKIVKS